MAPFLSKFRKRLIGSKKLSRYLLYALGEILLVMVGILLALQVDTWNEERKDRVITTKNIEALRADLARDTSLIRKTLELAQRDSALLGSIVRKISQPGISLDSLIYLARYEFSPWIFSEVTFNNNTHKSLLSTGELKILPEDLQDKLMELNSLQENYKLGTRADVDIYLQNTIAYSRKYPFNDAGHMDPDSRLADLIWDQATLADLGRELNSLIGVKYSSYVASIPALQELHGKTEKVLQDLRYVKTLPDKDL
jgi:hypothetical protein